MASHQTAPVHVASALHCRKLWWPNCRRRCQKAHWTTAARPHASAGCPRKHWWPHSAGWRSVDLWSTAPRHPASVHWHHRPRWLQHRWCHQLCSFGPSLGPAPSAGAKLRPRTTGHSVAAQWPGRCKGCWRLRVAASCREISQWPPKLKALRMAVWTTWVDVNIWGARKWCKPLRLVCACKTKRRTPS